MHAHKQKNIIVDLSRVFVRFLHECAHCAMLDIFVCPDQKTQNKINVHQGIFVKEAAKLKPLVQKVNIMSILHNLNVLHAQLVISVMQQGFQRQNS